MHLIQTDTSKAEERDLIHAWVFFLKSKTFNVGGILTAYDARNPNTRYLQSIATGERKYLRLCETEEEVRGVYSWAAEEIICAYRAKVDLLVFDYLGPEIAFNLGLAPALKAVEHEHYVASKTHVTKLILFAEESIFHSSFFHQLSNKSIQRHDSIKDFFASESAKCSMPVLSNWSEAFQQNGHSPNSCYTHSKKEDRPHSILRYPMLIFVGGVVLSELTAYILIRQIVVLLESFTQKSRVREYKFRMNKSTAYSTWFVLCTLYEGLRKAYRSRLARELDILERKESPEINPALVSFASKLSLLASADNFESEDIDDLLYALADCSSSVSTLINENHYSSNYLGHNANLSLFVSHFVNALSRLKEIKEPLIHNLDMDIRERRIRSGLRTTEVEFDTKSAFIHELQRRFGASALLLSGGASNAYHHLGVAKCLLEHDLLPRHISGASGGALIGALLCTHTDEELRSLLNDWNKLSKIFDPCEGGWPKLLSNLCRIGTLFDDNVWTQKLKNKVCGSLTFIEAYRKTGRSLTITVYNIDDTKNHTRALNYKTTPDVVIYSAILASSALPKLLPPIELLRKDKNGNIVEYHAYGKFWRDGSFENELPVETLYEQFNVKFTIVSMVEPHISPFFYENKGAAGKVVQNLPGSGYRGGFMLSFLERLLKHNIKMWLELIRDFKLMPKIWQTDINSLFLGRTRGTVTMAVPIRLRDYYYIVSDPNTAAKMGDYVLTGEKMVYPKLRMIRDNLTIEKYLHRLAGERWSK